ncbi:hypothetical protein AA313_de0207685 [Arthrobotrys entomopaga]|nr:hypothetical protein AA313_de0207685 [Arthrobotrys entomopaga]
MDASGASAVPNQADTKILALPIEIQTHILSFLPFGSLIYASMTCKLWEEIATTVVPTEHIKYRTADYDTFHDLTGSMEAGEMAVVYRIQGDEIRVCRPHPSQEYFDDAAEDFVKRLSKIPLIDITRCKFLDDEALGPNMREKTILWRFHMLSPDGFVFEENLPVEEVDSGATVRGFIEHIVQVIKWHVFGPYDCYTKIRKQWKAGMPFQLEFYDYEIVETSPDSNGETEMIYLSFYVSWLFDGDSQNMYFDPVQDVPYDSPKAIINMSAKWNQEE